MTIKKYVAYWQATAEQRLRFHPADEQKMAGVQCDLLANRLPEPWFGKPSEAKIFRLSSHPGPRPNSDDDAEFALQWRKFCQAMMCERVSMEDLRRLNSSYMKEDLQSRYGHFGKFSLSYICDLRFVPYASRSKEALGTIGTGQNLLESSKRARDLVHKHLLPKARNGEILLLVMQSATEWGFTEAQKKFVGEGGVFVNKARTDVITPGSRVGPQIKKMLLRIGAISE